MARFTNPAAFTNAFQNQVALGSQMRAADQDEQIRAGQINRANTINALGKDPNATAEQYVRAGDVQTGNALAGLEADKAQANEVAFPKVGMIAAQISGIAGSRTEARGVQGRHSAERGALRHDGDAAHRGARQN
jgi:hypothetical protein